jgi:crotonobetainyl-CoA:carnitine CoA-transferase CaiB-like acyl-CoA transferase
MESLKGVRILDFFWAGAGAWASRYLAAYGAEVIRLEWKGNPDPLRHGGPFWPMPDGSQPATREDQSDRSAHFQNLNAGKFDISLNMRHPKGKELFRRLLPHGDVVTDNFTAPTMASWGFAYEEMIKYKPDLIYLQSSGFGARGPYREYRSWGPVAAAIGGVTYLGGLPDEFPTGFGNSYMDVQGGWMAALLVMAALRVKRRTGKGQYIDLAQSGAALMLTGTALLDAGANGRTFRRVANGPYGYASAPHSLYRCKGAEQWLAIDCPSEEAWRALVGVMGSPQWASDAKFATLEGRARNASELDRHIEAWTSIQDKYQVTECLQKAGVMAGPVQDPADRVHKDPQLAHRKFFVELPHSAMGKVTVERPAGLMSKSPHWVGGLPNRGTPGYGEDNEQVWGKLVGLSANEIAELRREGVI